MQTLPFIPENAPFTPEQRLWLNGYLAGLYSDASKQLPGPSLSVPEPAKPLLILYGSQTGTAEALAKKVGTAAKKSSFIPRVLGMDQFAQLDWAKEENLLVITSTYGDGEPPDNASGFWSYLSGDAAPKLAQLRYSVLALGDSNYEAFCQFGKLCDQRLEELGAQRIHARVDCDVDYDATAAAWTEGVLASLQSNTAPAEPMALTAGDRASTVATEAQLVPSGYSRKRPFPARLLVNRLLNAPGSAKEVRHYEIALDSSALSYETGDALGVIPSNCPELVAEVIAALGCDGEEAVASADGTETSLRLALTQIYDICRPSNELLAAAAARSSDELLGTLLDPRKSAELKQYLQGREVIDLLHSLRTPLPPAEFVTLLRKLQPRLYSISSSLKAFPDQVHLTVGTVRYDSHGRRRKGICSTFLAERCDSAMPLPVFVQTSHGFRLPQDPETPVIMVGPGTGIAPFRAFLHERRAVGAKGRNWLFFGDQRRATDYLYEEELEEMRRDGHLSRLDLAFSRDQEEKIYVQHRMLAAAGELWQWLEEGAHFYVCGDASRMAKDVDAALHTACEKGGGLSVENAAAYVQKLKSEKRYQRDVY
jgi:sulfite reductase (NADPH) flavoprotein alpha-component